MTLTPQKDIHKIIHGMLITAFCKIFAVLCSYLLYFVLAKVLGVEGLGLFSLAFTIVVAASFLGRFGLDYVLLRNATLYSASQQLGVLKAWYACAMLFAAVTSMLLCAGIFLSGSWLCHVAFNKPGLLAPLLWMTAGLIPQALLFLQAETLKGAGHIRASQILQGDGGGVVVHGTALAFSIPLSFFYGVEGACIGFAGASWLAFFAGCRMVGHLFGEVKKQEAPPYKTLFHLGTPLFIASALSLIVARAGIVLLGIWESAAIVGIFALVHKLALLGSNIQTAGCTVVGPQIAVLYMKGNTAALAQYYRHGSRLILTLAFVALGGASLFASPLLGLFGSEFMNGVPILRLLCLGELLALLFGPVSLALITTGHSRQHCIAVGIASAVTLAVGLLLIPRYGLSGAAAAVAVSTVTQNAAQAIYVKRLLGFFPGVFRIGKIA